MNRGLTIAVAISLALNLFILGAGATLLTLRADLVRAPVAAPAAVAAGSPTAAAAPAPAANNPAAVLRDLSLDDREALTAALGVRQPKLVPLRKAAREARIQAADLLSASKVDRVALSAAMARARNAELSARAETEEAVIDVAVGLGQTDRTAIAEAIRPKVADPARARPQKKAAAQ